MSEVKNLVEVKNLKEYFNINVGMFRSKPLKAVDDVSFAIRKGETLGLVGESGCGKTTVGRTLLHLYKPTAGEIWFDGKQIVTKQDILEYRKKTAMVFQDPYSSLNPRMTVSDIIAEPLDVHKLYENKKERQEKIIENVIFNPPATIVFWSDKTKTIVKADYDYESYDPEKGIAMAIAKKLMGDNKGKYYDIFKHWREKWDKQNEATEDVKIDIPKNPIEKIFESIRPTIVVDDLLP